VADDKARIEASLEGAGQVASEAKKIEGALTGAAGKIEGKLGGALKSVTGHLGEVVKGGLAAAGVLGTVNLARAVEDVKRLDLLTGQLGQKIGVSSSTLQTGFAAMEQRILQSRLAQAEFVKQLGSLTYDSRGAAEALDGLGQHALASGRDLGEDLPLGKALKDLGVQGRDSLPELDRVRAIAEQLGTVGGHLALQDSLGRLDGLLQGVSTETDQSRGKLEALLGVLGKGQKTPERADQVRASTLGMIRSRALDIERATGHQVLDDNGNLMDPTQSLKDLRALTLRRFGGNAAAARRALISDFGADAGLAIWRGGFDQVDQLAGLTGTGATAADAARAKSDPAMQRRAKEMQKQSGMQEIAKLFVGADDWLTGMLGARGAAGLELGAGLATLFGGGKAAGAAGAAVKGAAAGGGLLPLLGALGFLAPAAGVLAEVGQDRESMGKDWRGGHAKEIGAELARRAQEQGGFSEDMFNPGAGQGRDALLEMLKILDSRKEQLDPEFAQQVAQALAAELRRAPLVVKQDRDPNQSGGAQ